MRKARILIAASITALTLAAAVSASAAQWYVNGAKLATSANIAATSTLDALEIIEAPGLNFRCTASGRSYGITQD